MERHRVRRRAGALALCIALALAAALPAAGAPAAPGGPGWDLGDLFASADDWQAALERTRAQAQQLASLRGTLGRPGALIQALSAVSDVRRATARLETYAQLRGDEDLGVAANQARVQQAQGLRALLEQNTAWLEPELRALGAQRIAAELAADPAGARRFDFWLHDLERRAPHLLDAQGELLLAGARRVFQQPGSLYSQLANAELPFPTLQLSAPAPVRLDQTAYEHWRSSPLRAERKQVFDAFWNTWKSHQATLGANLATQVQAEVFLARARHFDSALDAALDDNAMPAEVYRTLVTQAHAALPALHRYLRLRKRLLGIEDELAYYDNYASLFPVPPGLDFSLQESQRITLAALAPLGEDYLQLLRRGFAAHWMNAAPHPGKASGAYMSGSAYDVHPYLLLNHTSDFASLSAFAHEWGHAVHTLLTDRSQPYEKSDYSTFIAETASIGNEFLLSDYLIAYARNAAEKQYYLGQQLESIRTEFFRQAMLAEFQLAIHREVEQDQPLTGERLSGMYCQLLRRYYGEAEGVMRIDPLYCNEWAFFPHLYYGFYVWQYATSTAGAALLTEAVVHQGDAARQRFLALLSAGGSDHPYPLYLQAGIDMATPRPYQALRERMERDLDQLEALRPASATP